MIRWTHLVSASASALVALAPAAQAGHVVEAKPFEGVALVMPQMDPERGKVAFVEKGCVACHAINGVGGHDAPSLDAHTMDGLMNPFDFSARMWNHAPGMIATQREALGEQVTLTGQELADIIAFVHDEASQHTFTEGDLTPKAREMMDHEHGGAAPSEAHAEELGHHHGEEGGASRVGARISPSACGRGDENDLALDARGPVAAGSRLVCAFRLSESRAAP